MPTIHQQMLLCGVTACTHHCHFLSPSLHHRVAAMTTGMAAAQPMAWLQLHNDHMSQSDFAVHIYGR